MIHPMPAQRIDTVVADPVTGDQRRRTDYAGTVWYGDRPQITGAMVMSRGATAQITTPFWLLDSHVYEAGATGNAQIQASAAVQGTSEFSHLLEVGAGLGQDPQDSGALLGLRGCDRCRQPATRRRLPRHRHLRSRRDPATGHLTPRPLAGHRSATGVSMRCAGTTDVCRRSSRRSPRSAPLERVAPAQAGKAPSRPRGHRRDDDARAWCGPLQHGLHLPDIRGGMVTLRDRGPVLRLESGHARPRHGVAVQGRSRGPSARGDPLGRRRAGGRAEHAGPARRARRRAPRAGRPRARPGWTGARTLACRMCPAPRPSATAEW